MSGYHEVMKDVNKNNVNIEKLREFLKKNKLSLIKISTDSGMHPSTFSRKLNQKDKRGYPEKALFESVIKYLNNLSKDLNNLTKDQDG